jgi:hypothetical protein
MFHPTGARVDLFVFQLVHADRFPLMVEDHAAGAGGALIDGGNIFAHVSVLLKYYKIFFFQEKAQQVGVTRWAFFT